MEKIKAKDGYIFASKDMKTIFSNEVILGKNNKKEDYIEIKITDVPTQTEPTQTETDNIGIEYFDDLKRIYSKGGYKLKQNETGIIYGKEVIDSIYSNFTYTETNEKDVSEDD